MKINKNIFLPLSIFSLHQNATLFTSLLATLYKKKIKELRSKNVKTIIKKQRKSTRKIGVNSQQETMRQELLAIFSTPRALLLCSRWRIIMKYITFFSVLASWKQNCRLLIYILNFKNKFWEAFQKKINIADLRFIREIFD